MWGNRSAHTTRGIDERRGVFVHAIVNALYHLFVGDFNVSIYPHQFVYGYCHESGRTQSDWNLTAAVGQSSVDPP